MNNRYPLPYNAYSDPSFGSAEETDYEPIVQQQKIAFRNPNLNRPHLSLAVVQGIDPRYIEAHLKGFFIQGSQMRLHEVDTRDVIEVGRWYRYWWEHLAQVIRLLSPVTPNNLHPESMNFGWLKKVDRCFTEPVVTKQSYKCYNVIPDSRPMEYRHERFRIVRHILDEYSFVPPTNPLPKDRLDQEAQWLDSEPASPIETMAAQEKLAQAKSKRTTWDASEIGNFVYADYSEPRER